MWYCHSWPLDVRSNVGPLAKVGLSAKFGVVVSQCLYSQIDQGGPLAKVGFSAKFDVVVFKVISALLPRGSICQNVSFNDVNITILETLGNQWALIVEICYSWLLDVW